MNGEKKELDAAALFKFIPDFIEWEKAKNWIDEGKQIVNLLTHKQAMETDFAFLDWSQIRKDEDSHFGLFASQDFRKFVLAAFLSDLVSYPFPVDQVLFERLLFVMHRFPQGFRIWWTKLSNSVWCPVGYTGWYPMSETAFSVMEKSPGSLTERMVVPIPLGKNPYLYLFNYSVASNFKKTPLSKALMTRFAEDIITEKPSGFSCITVSEDGARVAMKFGMKHTGDFQCQGSTEGVYTHRS